MTRTFAITACCLVLCLFGPPSQAQSYDLPAFATEGETFENQSPGLTTLTPESATLRYLSAYGGILGGIGQTTSR